MKSMRLQVVQKMQFIIPLNFFDLRSFGDETDFENELYPRKIWVNSSNS